MIQRIESWFFTAEDPRALAAVRIGLFGVLALRLSRPMYVELAGQPKELFRPLSFMRLFDRMPPAGLVRVVQVIGVVSCLMAAAGLFSRISAIAGLGAGLLLGGMHNSLGKVMHNDVLLLLAIIPLVAAPIGDAWSLDSKRRRTIRRTNGHAYGWPLRTALLVVALGYFFAGLAKLINSGPAWVLSDNMRWILYASSDSQSSPNPLALFVANRPLLAKSMAAGALSYELSWPAAVLVRRLRPLFALGAVLLHGGIYLTMRLDYSAWIATVVVLTIDWSGLVDRLRGSR